jgi:hypothetical protein
VSKQPFEALLLPAMLALAADLYLWSELREFKGMEPFVETKGIVTSLECSNHGNYTVSFKAGPTSIERLSLPREHRRNCDSLYVGQDVTVWYSIRDPERASTLHPQQAEKVYLGEMQGITLFWLPVAAALSFLFAKYRNVPLWGRR